MPQQDPYDYCLQALEQRQVFEKSPVYLKLLRYLVAATKSGESPKELTIAVDVFHKSPTDQKSANIRPYISNLRKKLRTYYEHEGKNDSYQLEIPKGKYIVEYTRSAQSAGQRNLMYGVLSIIGGLLLVSLLYQGLDRGLWKTPTFEDTLWKGFLTNEKETLLVLGDHFFFKTRTLAGDVVAARNSSVNNEHDFEKYRKAMADTAAGKTMCYLNPQTAYGMFYFMPVLKEGSAETTLKMGSKLQWEMLREKNLIFFGSFKTLWLLNRTVKNLGIRYNLDGQLFFGVGEEIQEFSYSRGTAGSDMVSLIKFQTPDQREVMIMLSNYDFGNIAMAKHLTQLEKLIALNEQFGEMKHFRAVFSVKGAELSDFTLELMALEPIEESLLESWP